MSSLFWVHLDQEKQPSFAASITWKEAGLRPGGKSMISQSSAKEILEIRQGAAFVFQHYNLFANKTAIENILEGLIVAGKIPKKKPSNGQNPPLKKSASSLIRLLSFSIVERWSAATDRDCACRAHWKPGVILLDEPTSALVRIGRGRLRCHKTEWLKKA